MRLLLNRIVAAGFCAWLCAAFTVEAQVGNPQLPTLQLPTPVKVIYTFSLATNYVPFLGYTNTDGASCTAALIQGADSKLYGVAPSGGDAGGGTVFRLNPDGSDFTRLHSFSALAWHAGLSNNDGSDPTGLILGIDGKLYGTASQGGTSGFGAIFKLNTDGTGFTNLHSFVSNEGENPQGRLVQSPDGMLYGTAQKGGTNGSGTVFRLGPDGSGFAVLYDFTSLNDGTNNDGTQPVGGLALSEDGTLYGVARYGGPSGSIRPLAQDLVGSGTIFSLRTNGSGFRVMHAFDRFSGDILASTNSDGASPYSALILGKGGKLYGTAPEAGAGGSGTIFSVSTVGSKYTVLHTFNYAPPPRIGTPGYGLYPYGGLVEANDGMLYGAAYGGGLVNGYFGGTVYRLNEDGTDLALLHSFASPDSFNGTNADGTHPYATLLRANDGNLFGVTSTGGTNGSGTLFSFVPPILLKVSAAPNHIVQLTWSLSATNFVLETCATLSSGSVWTPLTNGIGTVNNSFVVTLPAASAAAFFRLHRP